MPRHKIVAPEATQDPSEPILVGPNRWTARITNDWVPLPEAAVKQLGWAEGTEVEIVPLMNQQILIRKKGALSDNTPTKEAPRGQAEG